MSVLAAIELVKPYAAASTMVCPGCEQACVEPVHVKDDQQEAFIVCEHRDDIGRVAVDAEELNRWVFGFDALHQAIVELLDSSKPARILSQQQFSYVGQLTTHSGAVDLFLLAGNVDIPHTHEADMRGAVRPLVMCVGAVAVTGYPALNLADAFFFNDGALFLAQDAIASAVAPPATDKKKTGAKPQHDWMAYKQQFDSIIAQFGFPGIDEPELKNQAALEKKLVEWGESEYGEAPSPASLRRYLPGWLTEAAQQKKKG